MPEMEFEVRANQLLPCNVSSLTRDIDPVVRYLSYFCHKPTAQHENMIAGRNTSTVFSKRKQT